MFENSRVYNHIYIFIYRLMGVGVTQSDPEYIEHPTVAIMVGTVNAETNWYAPTDVGDPRKVGNKSFTLFPP